MFLWSLKWSFLSLQRLWVMAPSVAPPHVLLAPPFCGHLAPPPRRQKNYTVTWQQTTVHQSVFGKPLLLHCPANKNIVFWPKLMFPNSCKKKAIYWSCDIHGSGLGFSVHTSQREDTLCVLIFCLTLYFLWGKNLRVWKQLIWRRAGGRGHSPGGRRCWVYRCWMWCSVVTGGVSGWALEDV